MKSYFAFFVLTSLLSSGCSVRTADSEMAGLSTTAKTGKITVFTASLRASGGELQKVRLQYNSVAKTLSLQTAGAVYVLRSVRLFKENLSVVSYQGTLGAERVELISDVKRELAKPLHAGMPSINKALGWPDTDLHLRISGEAWHGDMMSLNPLPEAAPVELDYKLRVFFDREPGKGMAKSFAGYNVLQSRREAARRYELTVRTTDTIEAILRKMSATAGVADVKPFVPYFPKLWPAIGASN